MVNQTNHFRVLLMLKKLLLLFITMTILLSCHSKPKGIKPSSQILAAEQQTRDLFIKYEKKKYGKWQELQRLLANDLISAKELDVIDCRGFDYQSDLLRFKQSNIVNIHGGGYSWNAYETNEGICISFNITIGRFFLSVDEARVLLSATQGYHFDRLEIEKPKFLFKLTILQDKRYILCGETIKKVIGNAEISSNACQEQIFYTYPEPPKKPSQSYFQDG